MASTGNEKLREESAADAHCVGSLEYVTSAMGVLVLTVPNPPCQLSDTLPEELLKTMAEFLDVGDEQVVARHYVRRFRPYPVRRKGVKEDSTVCRHSITPGSIRLQQVTEILYISPLHLDVD